MGLIRRWREASQQIREEEEAENKKWEEDARRTMQSYYEQRFPHLARYKGHELELDFVLNDICRRVGEIETWFEHNITKR